MHYANRPQLFSYLVPVILLYKELKRHISNMLLLSSKCIDASSANMRSRTMCEFHQTIRQQYRIMIKKSWEKTKRKIYT